MRMNSPEYWKKRQDSRLSYSERVATQTISNISKIYDNSLQHVSKRIDNILDNYSKDIGIPKDKLKRLLNDHEKYSLISDIEKRFVEHGLSKNNIDWIRGNYLYRLDEQQAIKLELESERRLISEYETKISTLGYEKTIEETYKSLVNDLTGKQGVLSSSAKKMMLNKKWQADKNYSNRIWTNTGQLANDLHRMINSGLISGITRVDMQREIIESYNVALFKVERLVRTEMNYFENASELQSYIDDGVTEYEYFSIRDKRTSNVCSHLDGKIFKTKDAQVGVNYPPMHPNCRSGTIPVIDSMI